MTLSYYYRSSAKRKKAASYNQINFWLKVDTYIQGRNRLNVEVFPRLFT